MPPNPGPPERLAQQQDAYYDLGNALYREGQKSEKNDAQKTVESWTGAVKAYDAALQLRGDDADSKFNRDFVKRKLDRSRSSSKANRGRDNERWSKDQSKDSKGQSKDQSQRFIGKLVRVSSSPNSQANQPPQSAQSQERRRQQGQPQQGHARQDQGQAATGPGSTGPASTRSGSASTVAVRVRTVSATATPQGGARPVTAASGPGDLRRREPAADGTKPRRDAKRGRTGASRAK